MHSFDLHLGKNGTQTLETIPSIGVCGNIVLNFIAKARLPSLQGHKKFSDNFFNSMSLMEEMKLRGYLASRVCSLMGNVQYLRETS